jgi:hypothetical protein
MVASRTSPPLLAQEFADTGSQEQPSRAARVAVKAQVL